MPNAQDNQADLSRILHNWEDIDFLYVALVVGVAAGLILGIRALTPWLSRTLPDRLRFYLLPWIPVLRLIIIVIAVIQVVPRVIQPTTENLLALVSATAIALGFAMKDYASSLIAGVIVLFERPYSAGDWVTVDGVYGEVQSLGFRSFTVVTPDDTVVTIPNSKIWDTPVLNENSGERALQCVADFYLHPEHDAEAVRQALWDVGISSPYLSLDHSVVVVVAEQPWATHYRLKAYPLDGRDQFLFVSDLTIRGKAELRRLGVDFASTAVAAT